MFVTKSQIFVFIACVAFGGISGIWFSFSGFIKFFIKKKITKIIIDLIFSLPISALFIIYSYQLKFPNIRAYMLFGLFLGIYLYFKSFYILLAKCAEKIYNICKRKRKLKNDRNKGKKVNCCGHGGCGSTLGDFARNNGLSTDFDGGLQ